jgi:hypothetical protein
MPVRDQNKIDIFQRGKFVVSFIVNRVRELGIDQKNFSSRGHDPKSRLAVPSELRFHASDETENSCSSKAGSTLQRFNDSTWQSHSTFGIRHFNWDP